MENGYSSCSQTPGINDPVISPMNLGLPVSTIFGSMVRPGYHRQVYDACTHVDGRPFIVRPEQVSRVYAKVKSVALRQGYTEKWGSRPLSVKHSFKSEACLVNTLNDPHLVDPLVLNRKSLCQTSR